MLARLGLFTQDEPRNIYAKHFPSKLYSALERIGLIALEEMKFELEENKSILLLLKKEIFQGHTDYNAVSITIETMRLDPISNTKNVNSKIYIFTNQNGLLLTSINEKGEHNNEYYQPDAFLLSGQLFPNAITKQFVDDIFTILKSIAPEKIIPNPSNAWRCHVL